MVVWFRGTEWGRGCVAVACRLWLGLAQVPAHKSRMILLMAVFQVLYMSRHPLHPLHTQHAPVAVLHWGTLVIEEQAAGADYTHTHTHRTALLMSYVLHDIYAYFDFHAICRVKRSVFWTQREWEKERERFGVSYSLMRNNMHFRLLQQPRLHHTLAESVGPL